MPDFSSDPGIRTSVLSPFLETLDKECDKGKVLHIILDNYSTHISKETNAYLSSDEVKDRFALHFIPPHSSWLNMVERWCGLKVRKIRRKSWESVEQLTQAIREYIQTWNALGRKFVWAKKADDILASIEKARQPAPHFV